MPLSEFLTYLAILILIACGFAFALNLPKCNVCKGLLIKKQGKTYCPECKKFFEKQYNEYKP
jgi:hypothetical protein